MLRDGRRSTDLLLGPDVLRVQRCVEYSLRGVPLLQGHEDVGGGDEFGIGEPLRDPGGEGGRFVLFEQACAQSCRRNLLVSFVLFG